MSDRDWEAELKKIDRQMEKVSDKAIFPPPPPTAPAAQRAAVAEVQRTTSSFGVFARLSLAVALGVGIVFWPYSARCGFGLAAYLGAVTALIVSGGWSSVWTWRHRAARAHVLSLLLLTWGLVLAATEVLPRVGYAIPTVAHPATWGCAP
jgi:hypothetical protein